MKTNLKLIGLLAISSLMLSACGGNNPDTITGESHHEDDSSSIVTDTSGEESTSEEVEASWPEEVKEDMLAFLGEVLPAYPVSDDYDYYDETDVDFAPNVGCTFFDNKPSVSAEEYVSYLSGLGDEWAEIIYDEDLDWYETEKEWTTEEGKQLISWFTFYSDMEDEEPYFGLQFYFEEKEIIEYLTEWPTEAEELMNSTIKEVLPFSEETFVIDTEFDGEDYSFIAYMEATGEEGYDEKYAAALDEGGFKPKKDAASDCYVGSKESTYKMPYGEKTYDALLNVYIYYDYELNEATYEYDIYFVVEAYLVMDYQLSEGFPTEEFNVFLDGVEFPLTGDMFNKALLPLEEYNGFIWAYQNGQFLFYALDDNSGSIDLLLELAKNEYQVVLEEIGGEEENDPSLRLEDEEEEESALQVTFSDFKYSFDGTVYIDSSNMVAFAIAHHKASESDVPYVKELPAESFLSSFELPVPAPVYKTFGYRYYETSGVGALVELLDPIESVIPNYLEALDTKEIAYESHDVLGTVMYSATLLNEAGLIENVLFYSFMGIAYFVYMVQEPVNEIDFTSDISGLVSSYTEGEEMQIYVPAHDLMVTLSKGTSSLDLGNDAHNIAYIYGTSDGYRCYTGQTITIAPNGSGEMPTTITLETNKGNSIPVTVSGGTLNGNVITIDEDATEVVITATAQVRVHNISFGYAM